jgi:3-hydroxyacyl-CoA dehydrogenase
MKRAIEKIVVLGAGTMGARIAAHVANAGVWCALLDMVPPEPNAEEKKRGLTVANAEVRTRIVRAGSKIASSRAISTTI